MLLTYVLSLGHTCHILPRLVVVGLCWVGEFLFSRAINGNSVYFWVIYTDLHTHCHQNILTKACIQLQLVMHNARSLLGVSSSICPAQSRQALIFAERRQAVLLMSVLGGLGWISDNAGQRRLLGVMARLILYAYMPTCLHTYKQTHTEAQAYQCLSSSCYWQTIQKQ